jgi:transcriptional regulator with XRE-family HTH domain
MATSSLVGLIDSFTARRAILDAAEVARRLGISDHMLAEWRMHGLNELPSRRVLETIAAAIERPYSIVLDAALSDTGYRDINDNPIARPWANDIGRLIDEQCGIELRRQREAVEGIISSDDPFSVNMYVHPGPVRAMSITQPFEIVVGPNVIDPTPHGTFSEHLNARAIILYVQRSTRQRSGGKVGTWDRLPLEEEEEWVYAALGPRWFDYAFRTVTGRMLFRAKPSRYVVFVTPNGEPFLPPGDFAWHIAAEGDGPTVRQKLRPRAASAELKDTLSNIGDVVPIDHVSTGIIPARYS